MSETGRKPIGKQSAMLFVSTPRESDLVKNGAGKKKAEVVKWRTMNKPRNVTLRNL